MNKTILQNFLIVASFLMLFPFFYNAPFYFSYWSMKEYLDTANEKKVVVIYDSFVDDTHGEIVSEIFSNSTSDSRYSTLKIDQHEVRIETLKLIIGHLVSKDKEVYLNLSIQPTYGTYASVFSTIIHDISEDATVTQSSGNNLYSPSFIKRYTSEAVELDKEIYKSLNTRVSEIKTIAEDESLNDVISLVGIPYAVAYSKFVESRDIKMEKLTRETVHPILKAHRLLKHEDEIVKYYTSILLGFSYTFLLLQKDDRNNSLIIVSSSSQFEDDAENIYFLDCRIDNLIQSDVRYPGVYVKDGEQFFGTSISAPLALASTFNEKLDIQ